MLLDKEGTAIQANMNLKDTDYFNEVLQPNNAYRISRFVCTETKKWQRTVNNKTTLLFGKYTSFEPFPVDPFPEHYFKFIAYNEVDQRAEVDGAPLTDYLGCIHQISDPIISGDATRSRRIRRIIQIQNLEGVNLPFVIWNEQAEGFDMEAYAHMPKPVVIAVVQLGPSRMTWEQQTYCRYCLRAVIDDGTATTAITCFSPEAHTFVPECNTVVATIGDQETEAIPAALKEAENKTYIFQYHFGKKAAPGNPAFTLDTVFRPSTQPLLTLPTTEVTTPSRLEIQPETFAPTKTPPTTEVTTHYPVDIQSQKSASTKTKDQEPQAQPEARLIRARRQLFEKDPATKKPRK
ncbi:hypothetical protein Tco_0576762 [Tanacetum coccineum]